MASDVTSESLDVTITKIPEFLQEYVKTRVAEYITRSKDVSMEIHQVEGQNAKLVMTVGIFSGNGDLQRTGNATNMEVTRTVLVRNLPTCVDEDLIQAFFETNKKYGVEPVERVKMFEDRNTTLVKFCKEGSVETVLEKKPIMFGKTKLIVKPFDELIADTETITSVELKGVLSKTFTDDLLKENFDSLVPPISGPALAEMMRVGTRVTRGKDWEYWSEDDGGEGTVIELLQDPNYDVKVKWDTEGVPTYCYRMGKGGFYDLKLAP